jgi:YjbE family integral membrane protein
MLAGLIEIVWLDLILSGDNAVLLALTTRALPMDQRRLGVNVGTILFIVLRIALAYALFVTANVPGAALVGALLLALSVPALVRRGLGAEAQAPPPRRTLGAALLACVATDAPNALWNMLAVQGAAAGVKPLVMFGLALSIPLLALGSIQFITVLRKPPLLWASVGLIGWTAGKMAASDAFLAALPPSAHNLAQAGGAALALLLAFIVWRGRRPEGAN